MKQKMVGSKAYELMKQGTVIKNGEILYRMDGNEVVYSTLLSKMCWSPASAFDILNNQYEEHQKTGWERVDKGEDYYWISPESFIVPDRELSYESDNELYDRINYFSTEEKAREIGCKQMLFRELQKFSDEHGGNEIDWSDENQSKYFIKYSHFSSRLIIDSYNSIQHLGVVYFVSKDIARQAMELFKDDLIKYFTHNWNE